MAEPNPEGHTFTNLFRRLLEAGFEKKFLRQAVLPDWWNNTCVNDQDLLPEIELRLARFLDLSLSAIRNPQTSLLPTPNPKVQLRRVRSIDRDRLSPAIHSSKKIAEAVISTLGNLPNNSKSLPKSGFQWRESLKGQNKQISLENILADLWANGIPVIPIETLPSPSFQGAAFIIDDRPVILLGHKHDEPGHVAFIVSHEAGHIAAGDCTSEQPVVDEEVEVLDDIEMEKKADQYAMNLLAGADSPPTITGEDYKALANQAAELESKHGVDAGITIFSWATQRGGDEDFKQAKRAIAALYRDKGARQLLRRFFDRYVNLEEASESHRSLLRCVYGEPQKNEDTN